MSPAEWEAYVREVAAALGVPAHVEDHTAAGYSQAWILRGGTWAASLSCEPSGALWAAVTTDRTTGGRYSTTPSPRDVADDVRVWIAGLTALPR